MATYPIRLTEMAQGGGCGCKLAPAVLEKILAKMPVTAGVRQLLVGTETDDDAAVYQINEHQAIVATTDFFTPIVDDPFDFGRIAATNALSDVYAMGGTPLLALAIVGMPVDKMPVEVVQEILVGGASVCSAAGIPVAGGHSIDSPEPIYGLVAIGLVDPARVLRNKTARAGDNIILTKPLGAGIYSAALKCQELDDDLYQEMVQSMTQLNSVGAEIPNIAGVHAMTDVTGFGLLGHLLEMCRGAALLADVDFQAVPLFIGARDLAEGGVGTGGAKRNWKSYGPQIEIPADAPEWWRAVLCDPQTSGGLLIACSPDSVPDVLALVRTRSSAPACVVGRFCDGPPRVRVA
ncbi:MAG TPA: selenide, water dikinase SelD [Bryobacteraceae bacterium]|nr:selenide, water dikinase SelD [Bryobacteraceae bacterium]